MSPYFKELKATGIANDLSQLLLDINSNHFVMEHIQAQVEQYEPRLFTKVTPTPPAKQSKVQAAVERIMGGNKKQNHLNEVTRREELNAQLAFQLIFTPSQSAKKTVYHEPNNANEIIETIIQKEAKRQSLLQQAKVKENLAPPPTLNKEPTPQTDNDKEISLSEFDNGLYFEFAVSLLETVADDIIEARARLAKYEPGSKKHTYAQEVLDEALHWLDGGDAPLTLEDCAQILEEEMQLQSLYQVDTPNIQQRFLELGKWVQEDPINVKKMLRTYTTLFSTMSDSIFDEQYHSREAPFDDEAEYAYEEPDPRRLRVKHR